LGYSEGDGAGIGFPGSEEEEESTIVAEEEEHEEFWEEADLVFNPEN
jgi:hypothetical protein